MPFFKCESGLVYFFHVPKCGGGTIEVALQNKGFKLSFYDDGFWRNIESNYYKTSPQHLTVQDFNCLFAEDIFSYKFAVVRDPVERLLSAFSNNREKIGRFVSLETFILKLEKNVASEKDYFSRKYDNHFVPASRLVPEDCNIFYLDNGLKDLEVELFDKLNIKLDFSQKEHIGVYDVGSDNKVKDLIKKLIIPPSPKINNVSEKLVTRIKYLFREDYQRFDFG